MTGERFAGTIGFHTSIDANNDASGHNCIAETEEPNTDRLSRKAPGHFPTEGEMHQHGLIKDRCAFCHSELQCIHKI